jgi:O-antigen/teichoic acid export membrane protein
MSKDILFSKSDLFFTILRYLIFFIQAVKGFVLAYFLGPFFLGIYGFIMLYQQYLSYSNLGIEYSINSEVAVLDVNNIIEKQNLINSAFTWTLFMSILLMVISSVIFVFKLELFPFHNSHEYIFIIMLLTVFGHFQKIFVNIFRIEKKLKPIILSEFVTVSSLFLIIFLFEGIDLINAILYGWTLIVLLILFYFKLIYKTPIRFNTSRIKHLLKIGLPLLIYAFSYYLMSLMTRTFIGVYYPTEIMGYFSIAINITTATMLGLNTITWLIFPSLIKKLEDNSLNKEQLTNYIIKVGNKILAIVLTIIVISVLLLPAVFHFLEEYKPVLFTLIILLINQLVFNATYVIVTLSIARKLHLQIALISVISVLVSTVVSYFFSELGYPYIWLAVCNVFGNLIFCNLLIRFVSKKLELDLRKLKKMFNWDIQLLIILSVIAAIFEFYWLVILVLFIMGILKYKFVMNIYHQIVRTVISSMDRT